MKVSITVRDDEGRVYQGSAVLVVTSPDHELTEAPALLTGGTVPETWASDLELPMRAFMKKYAPGKSGARKFAMLLAHMTKGDSRACVHVADIQREWNKMTAILGGAYNPAHSTRAKERGWVDSPKWGTFTLLRGWEITAVDSASSG